MKHLSIITALLVVFLVTATASASGPDALRSPLPTVALPTMRHYPAPLMPDAWYHLRAVPLTAEDWAMLGR